jgi:hypothetical protein
VSPGNDDPSGMKISWPMKFPWDISQILGTNGADEYITS